jgi:hypothetical protein
VSGLVEVRTFDNFHRSAAASSRASIRQPRFLEVTAESISRLFAPVPIHVAEAIPIACLGLAVNIASAWLLAS